MTKEEKQQLEDKAKALRETADQAHQAVADKPEDETLQTAADKAEEAAVKAQEESDAATVDETPAPLIGDEEEDDEEDIDFEEELENLGGDKPKKTELEKAERALHFNAEQVRKLGGDPTKILKPKKEETPPAPPAPPADARFVTRDDLDKRDLLAELRKLARTDAEYQVLVHHSEHSIKLTGNPAKDAESAYLIAHKGKIKRSFDEIRRAGFSRPAPGSPPGHRPPSKPVAAVQLTSDEQSTLRRRGFKLQADGSWVGKHYTMKYDAVKKGWVQEPNKK